MDFEYTISICHYEMVETVETSVESILSLTDDRFEILVVDGGSTDGSLQVLQNLADEYDRLCVVVSEEGRLSDDRNRSVEEAKGNHVLMQLDADDRYLYGIQSFVKIYELLREVQDEEFYLKGNNINVGSKRLLCEYGPYRPDLNRGEDADLWRRLFAEDDIVWLEHEPISESIGYDPALVGHLQQRIDRYRTDIITGVDPRSIARWILANRSGMRLVYDLAVAFGVVFTTIRDDRFTLPESVSEKGDLKERIQREGQTVRELEEAFDIDICSELDETGKEVFC